MQRRIVGEINMSLEPGGMGDKLGNMYEDRYFAVLMLRLVRERIKAITVEKLCPVGDYSEYITEENVTFSAKQVMEQNHNGVFLI